MKVLCIVTKDTKMVGLTGTLEIFETTNQVLMQLGKNPVFKTEVVGVSNDTFSTSQSIQALYSKTIYDIKETADLIIIPGLNGNPLEAIDNAKELIPFLQEQYRNGCELASLCSGSFFLAASGLLSKENYLTTHWIVSDLFKEAFPDVNLMLENVITDKDGIYSSGGATSSFNLLIYLVEKFLNKELALVVSKIFGLDYSRTSQSHFAIFSPLKKHEDEVILKAQNYIEENYANNFSIADIAENMALSKRSFIRRFKKATNNTPIEYVQRVKIEAAKRLLEKNTTTNINDIMYDVGYNDAKGFRNLFKRFTGLTPTEYRGKYTRLQVA